MANEFLRELLSTSSKIMNKEIADAVHEKDYEAAIIISFFNGLVKEAEKSVN